MFVEVFWVALLDCLVVCCLGVAWLVYSIVVLRFEVVSVCDCICVLLWVIVIYVAGD